MSEMEELLVSVVTPVYNTKPYLRDCVTSILSQTYSNWELILVDDGSTDESGSICDEYAGKDNRIHCIHKSNGGLSSAREVGIRAANGAYVMFVDSDDWVEADTIKRCVSIIRDHRVECVCFSYVREYPNASLPVHIYEHSMDFSKGNAAEFYRRFWGLYGNELKHPERCDSIVTCWGKLYSRALLENAKFFDTKIIGGSEDALFNIYALNHCKNAYYLDVPLYHYRKQEGGTLSSSYRPKLQSQYGELYKEFFRAQNDLKTDDDCHLALNNRILLTLIGIGLNESANPKKSERVKNIRKYIKSDFYQNGYRSAQRKYLPFPWNTFIFCAGHGLAFPVYLMLIAMKYLKSRI